MTTPISDPTAPDSQPKAESFLDWFHINSRVVTAGAAVVIIAAGALWFVKRTQMNETISSDRQLLLAKQSLGSGNEQLALADLKKVMDKYGKKPAGAEAGMIIATTQMGKGDYKSAVATLKDLADKAGDASAASVRSLLGDALSQAGQPAEAAAEYDKAAAATQMVLEKATYEAKAARAYSAAGKTAEAKKLYELLAAQSDYAALSAEAKVRLGELSVASKP